MNLLSIFNQLRDHYDHFVATHQKNPSHIFVSSAVFNLLYMNGVSYIGVAFVRPHPGLLDKDVYLETKLVPRPNLQNIIFGDGVVA